MRSKSEYGRLTPQMMLNLAAPHTWPAAIMPTLLAVCLASSYAGASISVTLTLSLLCAVVLMQSAANTFNDYFDFVKGTDSEDDYVDPSDSVLVYNNVNPSHVRLLGIGFIVAAFAFGVYAIAVAGIAPLLIALVGAAFVVLYSAGKTPVSYLPIGELVSGIVMGGLIPLACYQVLTLSLDFLVLVWAIPTIIGVGLIMLTNNTCDIERDIEAGRRTYPIVVGRLNARVTYHALMVVWIVAITVIVAIWFTSGLLVIPFMLLAAYPIVRALWENPLVPERRLQAMPHILSVNVVLGAFYCCAICASTFTLAL